MKAKSRCVAEGKSKEVKRVKAMGDKDSEFGGSRSRRGASLFLTCSFKKNIGIICILVITDEWLFYMFFIYFILLLQYVRVSSNTPPRVIYQLMTQHWGLDVPNLLISVTGGAKNFNMKLRLKSIFRRGLVKVAQTTGKRSSGPKILGEELVMNSSW